MNKRQELEKCFFNVQMPKWYRLASLVLRLLCIVVVVVVVASGQIFGVNDVHTKVWIVIAAGLVAALPSLPKAIIEQRNRLRGLRDGSFQKYLEQQRSDDNSS